VTEGRISAPVPLGAEHDLDAFDCGVPALDEWLKQRARKNEVAGASRTYVVCVQNTVIGYYCLAAGAIAHPEAPKALRRNMPDPIPVMVLGRLAIDRHYQNRGIGRALLRDAVLHALEAAEIAGVKALLVHAISEEAKRFYFSRGFVESPVQPMTLSLTMEKARKAIRLE
jgi:GNAT superfamily N-acetyltransferase